MSFGSGANPIGTATILLPPKSSTPEPPKPARGASRYINFYGEDFSTPTTNYSFSVLCGDQPPTIVGGYAKWQIIDRPLRRGLTMFQGYDPISMQVSVRFMKFSSNGTWLTDANDSSSTAGKEIDRELEILEWMAGESIGNGPSPKVWLTTSGGDGNTIPLIPFEYQADVGAPKTYGAGGSTPWVVIGLSWDSAPIRSQWGYRIRQDATVTLQYYQAPPGAVPSLLGLDSSRARSFTSRSGADTALLIARHEPTTDPVDLANLIRKAPQNAKLRLRSNYAPIKHGKKVYIPAGVSVAGIAAGLGSTIVSGS